MTHDLKSCFNCGRNTTNTLYDIVVCSECESKLKLMSDETIKKHASDKLNFKKEAQFKLKTLEKDYARKKIKLLHILDKLESS